MYLELITARVGKRKDCQLNFAEIDPNLKNKKETDYPFCIPTYLYGYDGGESSELLRLYSPTTVTLKRLREEHKINFSEDKSYCPILFQTDKGEESVFLKEIRINNSTITIFFSRTKENWTISENPYFEFTHIHNASERYWRLMYKKNILTHENIQIVFKLEDSESNTHQIQICIAPVAQIRDIVVDFGSEASQIATFFRDDDQDINNIKDLFSNMKEMLASDNAKENKDAEWVQRSESAKLYRSIFYGRQDYQGDIDALNAGMQCSHDDILRMLTTRQEAQDLLKNGYIVLPTVKLSGYGGILQPKFNESYPILEFKEHFFYRKCINNLLLSEFLSIRKIEKGKSLCVNICLLVPNVFRPKQVAEIVRNLRYDINKMIEAEKLTDTIAAIEINTVSESDASLIGSLEFLSDNKSTTKGDKQYLVMDAGKGTLDISVIKHDDNNGKGHYICRYRSGVLGAGNAITFAYMCALLHDFLSLNNRESVTKENLAQFIKEKILKDNERYLINKMFDAVENFKQKKIDGNHANSVGGNKDLKNFIVYIQNNPTLSDDAKKWISATINMITKKVLKGLEIAKSDDIGKIDYVYYTGRAFRCAELKESIQNAIKQEGITTDSTIELNSEINELTEVDFDKLLCLYICKAVIKGTCSENTLCLPFIHHQYIDHQYIGQNSGYGVLEDIWYKISGKHPVLKQKFLSINASPIVTSRYSINNSTPEELYSRGMRMGFELLLSPTDKLYYNGFYYRVEGNEKPISGKILLFMVNGKMYIRLANKATRRTEEETCFSFVENAIDLSSSPLKYGTFFPNVGMDNPVELIEYNQAEISGETESNNSQSQSPNQRGQAAENNDSVVSQFQVQ